VVQHRIAAAAVVVVAAKEGAVAAAKPNRNLALRPRRPCCDVAVEHGDAAADGEDAGAAGVGDDDDGANVAAERPGAGDGAHDGVAERHVPRPQKQLRLAELRARNGGMGNTTL